MYQFSSVAQLCPTLCNPMDCSMPGFPVHHQLPELIQTHVHSVGISPKFLNRSELMYSSNRRIQKKKNCLESGVL